MTLISEHSQVNFSICNDWMPAYGMVSNLVNLRSTCKVINLWVSSSWLSVPLTACKSDFLPKLRCLESKYSGKKCCHEEARKHTRTRNGRGRIVVQIMPHIHYRKPIASKAGVEGIQERHTLVTRRPTIDNRNTASRATTPTPYRTPCYSALSMTWRPSRYLVTTRNAILSSLLTIHTRLTYTAVR